MSNPSSNLAMMSCSSSMAVVPPPPSLPSCQSFGSSSFASLCNDAAVQDGVLHEVFVLSNCRSCRRGARGQFQRAKSVSGSYAYCMRMKS